MKQRITPVYIYELRDPRDGKTYYVGKSVHPHTRFREHIAEAADLSLTTPKATWLRSLTKAGSHPQLVITLESKMTTWSEDEGRVIRQHLEAGSPLTNINRPSGSRRVKLSDYADNRSQDYWDDLTVNLKRLKFRMYPLKVKGGYILQKLWNLDGRGWRHMEDRWANLVEWHVRDEWQPALMPDESPEDHVQVQEALQQFWDANPDLEPGSFLGPPMHDFPLPFPTRRSIAASMDPRIDAKNAVFHDLGRYEVALTVEEMDPEDLGHSATAWRKEWYKRPSKGFNRSKH